MSTTAFLNVRDRVDQFGGFNFAFDAALVETTEDSNTITRHPVEFGADIADHNYANPRRWQMEYMVTDKPFNVITVSPGIAEEFTRSRAAWVALTAIRERGQIFDLQTNLEISNNVVITGLTVTQDKDTNRVIRVNAVLEEIIVVETELVDFPADLLDGTIQLQATSNVNGGRKQKQEVTNTRLLQKILGN